MSKTTAIGIDLGTTNSCVAVYRNGTFETIINTMGEKTTPSYVSFTDTDILVGHAAKEQCSINLSNTVFDVKRLIGLQFNDKNVIYDMKYWPFNVVEDNSKIMIKVRHANIEKLYSPVEISAMVLIYLKRIAEDFLDGPVKHAVITVPAYFNNSQREATKLAGEIAGLDVLRIVNEPTAAALAYSHTFKKNKSRTVVVYDFGGGTFDLSILKISGSNIKVLAVGGDTHLGGKEVDKNLVEHVIECLKKKHGSEIELNAKAMARLYNKCEKAKKKLSMAKSTIIELESLIKNLDTVEVITRETFDDLNSKLFQSTVPILDKCMSDAKLKKSDIDEIILVGGSTRIPKIQEMLATYFEDKPLCKSINPDESVATGAAMLAYRLHSQLPLDILEDVIPKSLGISVVNKSKNITDSDYCDVTSVVVEKNTKIPTQISKFYGTSEDYQTTIKISVYEGEEHYVKDNYLLGEFVIDGLTPAPKAETKCEVIFEIDNNGITSVIAKEINTKNCKKIKIDRNGAWSDEEIKRMIAAARQY